MDNTVVLYPSPGIGHLIAMVELGKLILSHQPSLSITIFIITAPYPTNSTAQYIDRVSATCPSITFHNLPTISVPSINHLELAFELPRLNNPNLHKAFQTLSQKSKLRAFIIDFFCNAAYDVSSSLNIPTYYFFTSGASGLSVFLYFPTFHAITTNNKDLPYLELPSVPLIATSDLPKVLVERNTPAYKNFFDTALVMAKSSGIITNTFEKLEPRAVKAISDGHSIPNGPTPPLYLVGPLIDSNGRTGDGDEHECLSWLNSQPSQSVVFLCFGSMGLFVEQQLKEMALGLENSGHRFLWVVRSPPTDDETQGMLARPEPDLDSLLPEGFLQRTKDRGLVIKNWAPQVAVLSHDSVGGFVTHCGWNSVLEAVFFGVPMVGWPLYAEQRLNRVFLVEEFKVALPLHQSEDGFVSAAELEKRVRELMDLESGRVVREKVRVMKDEARAAMETSTGSSRVDLVRLVDSWWK